MQEQEELQEELGIQSNISISSEDGRAMVLGWIDSFGSDGVVFDFDEEDPDLLLIASDGEITVTAPSKDLQLAVFFDGNVLPTNTLDELQQSMLFGSIYKFPALGLDLPGDWRVDLTQNLTSNTQILNYSLGLLTFSVEGIVSVVRGVDISVAEIPHFEVRTSLPYNLTVSGPVVSVNEGQ